MAKAANKAQVLRLEQRLRNQQISRTRQTLAAGADQAKRAAQKSAAKAREALKEAPVQVMAGGFAGTVAAGVVDTMIEPMAGGKLPVSVILGVLTGAGTYWAPKAYRPALSGAAVGLLAPVGLTIGRRIGLAVQALGG